MIPGASSRKLESGENPYRTQVQSRDVAILSPKFTACSYSDRFKCANFLALYCLTHVITEDTKSASGLGHNGSFLH